MTNTKKETCIINGIEKRFTAKRKEHAAALLETYGRNYPTELYQVYSTSCSYAKNYAMRRLQSIADNGIVKIVSHNTFRFTVVYKCTTQDGKTYIVYDTGRNEYIYPVPAAEC